MFRWGLSLAWLAGCAQIAGIDSTSKGPDAAVTQASLEVEHVAIGRTIVRGPENLTTKLASYLIPDATMPGGLRKLPATLSGLDTWIADVGETTYPIQYESPEINGTVLRIIDLPNRNLKAAVTVLEKPQFEPAIPMATLSVSVALPTAHNAESYQVHTLGAWTVVGIGAPGVGATQLVGGPVTLTPNNSPIARLDKFTTADAVFVLRYLGSQLVGHYDAPPFEQMMNNTITGTMATTTLDQTLNITVNQTAAAQRMSTVRPAVGAPSMVWRLNAAPGASLNNQSGPQLHAAGVGALDPQMITAAYGNPFAPLLPTVLTWTATSTRTYTMGASSIQLAAQMVQRATPMTGSTLDLTLPAGLPDRITANTTVLNVDNAMVMAPANAPVDVSFITDGTMNTLYHIELVELTPNMMGGFDSKVVVTTTHAMPSVKIPRDLFKPSTLYYMRAHSASGCYTGLASGDLTQLALPCATAFADSGVFQVVTP